MTQATALNDELTGALDAQLQRDHVEHARRTISPLDLDQLEQHWNATWQTLCQLFERAQELAQPTLITACASQVLQWPSYAREEDEWLTEDNLLNKTPKLSLLGKLRVSSPPTPEQLLALEHPEALPHVNLLHIRGRLSPALLKQLLSSPIMSQITELQLSCRQLGPEHLDAVLASPHREQLTALILERSELGLDGARQLGSRPWPALSHLDLNKGDLGNKGLEALLEGGNFPALKSLRLAENKLTGKAIQALKGLELTRLDLSFNQGKASMAKAIAQAAASTHLEHLNLGANEIGDQGLSALAQSPHLGALRSLHIADNHSPPLITDQGISALVNAQRIHALEHLKLSGSELTWQGMAAILSSPNMSKLRTLITASCDQLDLSSADLLTTIEPTAPLELLDLASCALSNPKAAAKLLPKLHLPKTLESLSLFNVELNPAMLEALGQHPHLLQHLRTLNLYGTPTKAKHVEALVALSMSALERLSIGGLSNHATPTLVERIAQASWFSQLRSLSINVTEKGSDALQPHIKQHRIICWD